MCVCVANMLQLLGMFVNQKAPSVCTIVTHGGLSTERRWTMYEDQNHQLTANLSQFKGELVRKMRTPWIRS